MTRTYFPPFKKIVKMNLKNKKEHRTGVSKTLKLFNAVIAQPSNQSPIVLEQGLVIDSGAIWAEKEILSFYQDENLDGYGLNKTFHKSWFKVKTSHGQALWMEQIRHYISTYGSNFQDEIYIPEEVLNVPDQKFIFKVIRGISKEELTQKCLDLLQSGIALKEETINDLLSILVDELQYSFTGNENIKNKEAVVKIADIYGVLPNTTLEFFPIHHLQSYRRCFTHQE